MIFAQSQYLFLLFLIPVFFLIQAVILRLRRRRIRRMGDEALVESLMPSYSSAKVWIRLVLFVLGFFFFVLAISRPQIGATLKERQTKGAEVMIALDVSNSMLAQDYSPDRLERAKLAISRMVDRLRDDRLGLIVFAGNSFVQLPITTDYVSAKMFLSSISTESVPIQGTAIGEAINTAMRSFSPQSDKSRAIIVITDGENHEDDPVAAARQASDLGVRVFTIGVGSPEGTMIPMADGDYLRDKDGNPVVTRLDETVLKDVAAAGKGMYVRAGNSEFGLNPIIDEIERMDDELYSSVVFEEYDELYMYFLAVALFFLILEMLVGERRARRTLLTLGLLVLLGVDASAQVDRKEVRQGNRRFRDAEYNEAEIAYLRALQKDSLSMAANYDLANTLYRMEEYDKAKSALERVGEVAQMSPYSADYFYNLGSVAIAQKDWKTAVEAYRQSLLRRPGDMDAKENYIYAKKMLQDQQQNQQDQNQDQNQDQQDQQNKDQQNQQQNQDQQQEQQQNQNQDQNQQQDQDNQQPDQITPQAAQQMLQAIQAKEKETQDKVKKAKAAALKSRQKEKNW